MDTLRSAPLSSSGRPVFLEDEVELRSEANVAITLQDKNKVTGMLFPSGLLIVTNFRLITIQDNIAGKLGWSIELSQVHRVEDCSRYFSRSTRLRLDFKQSNVNLGLKFSESGKESILSVINVALEKKSWDIKTLQWNIKATLPVFSSSNAGINGIIRRQERSIQQVDSISKSALSDLHLLIDRAKDAIAVVQRYAAYNDRDTNNETQSEISEMEGILQSIGLVSPVTKFSAGRLYHEQLAGQVADLLLCGDRLRRLGGMITLTDLYCVVNRARGGVLVSPDDLLHSAQMMGPMDLGIFLRCFPSGVKALQLAAYSEEEFCKRIVGIFTTEATRSGSNRDYGKQGLLASDVARELNVSIQVAQEQLLIAEANKYLCRDESGYGVYFFPETFSEYCELITNK